MIILGINNMHDSSAAIVVDGKLIAAAEEERFRRIKHVKGFPRNAIRFCLDYAGVTMQDVDSICASWRPWVLRVRATQALKSFFTSASLFKAKASRGMGQMQNEWMELFRLRRLIEENFGKGKYTLEYIDHHLAHAVSAFYCSGFEKAAILTIDGAGEADTTALWIGEGRNIKKLTGVRLPNSLGQFYAAVTGFLGFKIQSDEYKVMGLAAYGEPVYADYLRKHVIELLPNGLFRIDPYFIDYHLSRNGIFRRKTVEVFGQPRNRNEEVTKQHADIAASAQVVVEETIFHLANYLYRVTKSDTLCMAGGVALNSVANGKLALHTPFREIFIQPAASDAGSSLGAALYLYHKLSQAERNFIMHDAYFGPSFSPAECKAALEEKNIPYRHDTEENLIRQTAQSLADGKLVCWFQGRMEWGPRALGSRSMIADPRRKEMKDIINDRVKKRESFRPFAPSILSEKADEFFEHYHHAPFMQFTFPVKKDRVDTIRAVVHVDGTARPQAVVKDSNPRYWKLIDEFRRITGIPCILNTSYNVQEPIVCTPGDAIRTFLETRMDLLVIGDYIAENKNTNRS